MPAHEHDEDQELLVEIVLFENPWDSKNAIDICIFFYVLLMIYYWDKTVVQLTFIIVDYSMILSKNY